MRRLLFCLLCLCACGVTGRAHVLDEYLQATQIAVSATGVRLELHLTPGVEVADQVFALIDRDRNDEISPAEGQDYARRLLDDVALEVDGRRLLVALTSMQFPSRSEMKKGDSVIRFELSADALSLAGEHNLIFRNNHWPEIGVYQANTLVPATDAIAITGQRRDPLQHEIQVSFRVLSPALGTARVAPALWPFWLWPAVVLSGVCLTLLFSRRLLR